MVSSYDVEFEADWGAETFTPTAMTLAHWLFDGEAHRLLMRLRPTSADEELVFETDVPFPWR